MNIVSRSGSQIIVNQSSQLNLITSSATSANISNLLVNLTFAASQGNITLISDITGQCNISGYQILGTYVSTQTVAMIGLNINTAIVNVNQVSFKPNAFNVGDISSYLFSQVKTCTITVTNFTVIIGNSPNFVLLGSLSSSSNYNYWFGGIISDLDSNVTVINKFCSSEKAGMWSSPLGSPLVECFYQK
ncbi:Hypothetical_protein [Hexamita inflata]|uniref:Hypothetical_protein n=1 Tax=Hexamita inflata TaxID=28002 RepID=A0AA86QY43_9EUKA|nr:Hypothetical protein HINF_LOCUS53968 [Hexamita inflata]